MMCMIQVFTFPMAEIIFRCSFLFCMPLCQSTERNPVSGTPSIDIFASECGEDWTTKCCRQDSTIQRNLSTRTTTMPIRLFHSSVLAVLGLLLVALSANAVEDRLSIPTNGACIDKHESKQECLEWAWYGEWYVHRKFECTLSITIVVSLTIGLAFAFVVIRSLKNPEFMHDQCRQSCGLCIPTPEEKGECQDHHPRCTEWAEKGNLHVNNLWYVPTIRARRL